jgi:hypothetical protein
VEEDDLGLGQGRPVLHVAGAWFKDVVAGEEGAFIGETHFADAQDVFDAGGVGGEFGETGARAAGLADEERAEIEVSGGDFG